MSSYTLGIDTSLTVEMDLKKLSDFFIISDFEKPVIWSNLLCFLSILQNQPNKNKNCCCHDLKKLSLKVTLFRIKKQIITTLLSNI